MNRSDDERLHGESPPVAQRSGDSGSRVYFAPEALAAYETLGFDASPAVDKDGVAARVESTDSPEDVRRGPGLGS